MKSGGGKRGGSLLDQMVLKSSHNSDRYKEADNEGNDNEEGRDDEYDEYGDEIIDLGDDIQPFSMQFKVDDSLKQITGVASKAEVKQKKVEPVIQEDQEEEPQLDLMKARKGFDLSEMILGRQSKPMEVEERSHGSSSSNKSDKEEFDWSKFDDQLPQNQAEDQDFQFEQSSPQQQNIDDDLEERVESDKEDDEPFSYDNSMYSKFSSSYKFNMNDLADFKKVSVESRTSPEDYERDWIKAARQNDDIDDDALFEPIQDDTFDEEESIRAPKLDISDLTAVTTQKGRNSTNKQAEVDRFSSFGSKNLSLMQGGLNELDLRKPISLEKKPQSALTPKDPSESSIDIIQHQKSTEADEEPELLRDKNVKIIKHTKNEVLEKLTGTVEIKDEDEIDEDSDFERMSNDDLNIEDPALLKKALPNNYVSVDKEGVRWTHHYANDETSWQKFKKFDRWMVIDGLRHTHEEQAKELLPANKGTQVSTRLDHIMTRLLQNLSARYQKQTKPKPPKHEKARFSSR